MKYTPHRPDRPPPMERWIFVVMLVMAGLSAGLGWGACIMGEWQPAVLFFLLSGICVVYTNWRVREAGWP